jgi:hypothetical protein
MYQSFQAQFSKFETPLYLLGGALCAWMGILREETIKLIFFMMKFVGAALAVFAGATWYSSAQR